MINSILAFGMPGAIEWIIILLIGLFVFVIPICVVALIIILIKKSNKERQNTQIEEPIVGDEL